MKKNVIILKLDTTGLTREKAMEYMEQARQNVVKSLDDETLKILVLPKSADISILPIE